MTFFFALSDSQCPNLALVRLGKGLVDVGLRGVAQTSRQDRAQVLVELACQQGVFVKHDRKLLPRDDVDDGIPVGDDIGRYWLLREHKGHLTKDSRRFQDCEDLSVLLHPDAATTNLIELLLADSAGPAFSTATEDAPEDCKVPLVCLGLRPLQEPGPILHGQRAADRCFLLCLELVDDFLSLVEVLGNEERELRVHASERKGTLNRDPS